MCSNTWQITSVLLGKKKRRSDSKGQLWSDYTGVQTLGLEGAWLISREHISKDKHGPRDEAESEHGSLGLSADTGTNTWYESLTF